MDRRTVWHYKKNHPEFQAEIDQAEADYCDQVEKYLLQAAEKLNLTAIIFYLTNRSPDRWKDRRNVPQIQQQVTDQDAALKAILNRLEGQKEAAELPSRNCSPVTGSQE